MQLVLNMPAFYEKTQAHLGVGSVLEFYIRKQRAKSDNSTARKFTMIQMPIPSKVEMSQVALAANAGPEMPKEDYTVADALTDYMTHYSKEGKGVSVTNNIIKSRILPKLGDIKVRELTTKAIAGWHYELSKSPANLRTKNGSLNQNVKPLDLDDVEAVRRRRLTANRVLSVLKAALNYVWREGTVDSDLAWRRVKPFRNVNAPVIRYLNKVECQRLVQACESDLRLIVQAALFSGCRYGEICRLVAADYRADTGTLYIRISKNGQRTLNRSCHSRATTSNVVLRHLENVQMIGIARLRYRPKTLLTAAWHGNRLDHCNQYLEHYRQILDGTLVRVA